MEIAGKVAWVTGGAKRVGREIAVTLAEHGCYVAINYRSSSKEALEAIEKIKRFGVKSFATQGDVALRKDVERMVLEIEKNVGPIDILINNASIFKRTPWPDISEEDWNEHLNINLKGPFLCAQATGAKMVIRGAGKIINIVDWAGERPYRHYMPYCVSKAGLICLTKSLAKELAPQVQVNAIGPGPVLLPEETTKEERAKVLKSVPLQREGSPKDIANAVLFLVEGTDFATGSIIYVDGGRLIA